MTLKILNTHQRDDPEHLGWQAGQQSAGHVQSADQGESWGARDRTRPRQTARGWRIGRNSLDQTYH